MKKLFLLLALLPLAAFAQDVTTQAQPATATHAQPAAPRAPRFGVIDYDGVLELMPEYKAAQEQVAALKAKYDTESERAEAEFQRKFAEFLDGQKEFPQNILEKRQKELQTLLEQSVQFRQSAQKLLKQAESDYTDNARRALDNVIQRVAATHNLVLVFNSSSNQLPYVDQTRVLDVEHLVLQALGLNK